MLRTVPADPIFQAAASGDVAAIKACLASNPSAVSQRDPNEQTLPILYAIQNEHIDAVQCLLSVGSPVDYLDIHNKKVILDFVPGTEAGKEIKMMLVKKVFNSYMDRSWMDAFSVYTKLRSVITLLLNFLISDYRQSTLVSLAKYVDQLDTHYSLHPSIKEWMEFLIYISEVCTKAGEVKDALRYFTKATNVFIEVLSQDMPTVERMDYVSLLIHIYQSLLTLLQNESVSQIVIKAVKDQKVTHNRLKTALSYFQTDSSELAVQLVGLNDNIKNFFEAYAKVTAQTASPKPSFFAPDFTAKPAASILKRSHGQVYEAAPQASTEITLQENQNKENQEGSVNKPKPKQVRFRF